MRGRHLSTLALTTVLVLGNVVCFNLLFGKIRGLRADLTDDGVYTLAAETKALLQEPEEPLELFFFFTSIDKLHEKLRPVALLIQDKVQEMGTASNGKVAVRLVDWEKADKAVTDRATNEFGVKPLQLQVQTADEAAIRNTYFAVVVAYGDRHERFEGRQLWRITSLGTDILVEPENVEYLVAKAVNKVVRGFNSVGAALASKNLEASVDFYFSPESELPENLKKVPVHAKKVSDKLKQDAGGRLKVSIADPTGDAPEAQALRAKLERQGLRDIQLDPTKPGFWSWAVVKVGKEAAPVALINFGDDLTESDVRDAIQGTLQQMIPGFLTVVGLAAPDPEEDPMARMMGKQAPPQEFADLREMLSAEFEVKSVDLKSGKPVPRDVSVLLLMRPADLSDRALFELDQFLMRGGRLVVCADPYGFDMQAAMSSRRLESKKYELGKLREVLRHYGAEVGEGYVLDTESWQMTLMDQVYEGGRQKPTAEKFKFPFFLAPPDADIDSKHPITARLRNLLFCRAVPVGLAEAVPAAESRPAKAGVPAGVTGAVLVRSSKDGSTTTDMEEGLRLAKAGGYSPPPAAKSYGLAVALQGKFPSYFADKPIPPAPGKADAPEAPASRPAEEARLIKQSSATSLVVVGDADFVSPLTSYFFQLQEDLKPNFAFVRNALDFGGDEQRLMAVRNREQARRPLVDLAKKTPEERGRSQDLARWAAFVAPCLALLALAAVWFFVRKSGSAAPPARSSAAAGAAS
jgi:ABC-2 type transport system permease protein